MRFGLAGIILRLLVVCVFLILQACATVPDHKVVEEKCIKIGQEWHYDHRQVDKGSRVVIIDVLMTKEKKRIYVVRVTGVVINHPNFRNYFVDKIPYFYITEKGLQDSLTTLIGDAKWNRYYDRHYQHWRQKNQREGYLGTTIKNKIRTLESILNVRLGA